MDGGACGGGGRGAPEMDADSPWSVVGTVATHPQRGHSGGQRLKGGTSQGAPIRGVDIGLGNPQPKAKRDWMEATCQRYGKCDGQHCTRYLSTLTPDFSRLTTPTLSTFPPHPTYAGHPWSSRLAGWVRASTGRHKIDR